MWLVYGVDMGTLLKIPLRTMDDGDSLSTLFKEGVGAMVGNRSSILCESILSCILFHEKMIIFLAAFHLFHFFELMKIVIRKSSFLLCLFRKMLHKCGIHDVLQEILLLEGR